MPIRTKWPRLLVVGQPVTEAQADEILIRTDPWYLSGNDRDWTRQLEQVAAEFGYPPEPPHTASTEQRRARWQQMKAWRSRIGVLQLEYLHNDRIVSSWAGGPHGWCDWDGRIGCATFNIGKWPSDDEVTEEWQTIARAFPYLDLVAQLVDDEGEGVLAGQWRVKDGQVEHDPDPAEMVTAPSDDAPWLSPLLVGGERGCSIGRFRQALTCVTGDGEPFHVLGD